MTNQPSPNPENNSQSGNLSQKIIQFLKKPQTQTIALITGSAIALTGYFGGKILLTNYIPEGLEGELERILGRQVKVGEIENLSLHQIILSDIIIPPSEKDSSYLNIDGLKIDINLWSFLLTRRLPINIIVSQIEGYGQLDTLLPEREEDKPLPESLLLPSLPITTDINLRLQSANLAISPNEVTPSIQLQTRGNIQLTYDSDTQPLQYNLSNRIGSSIINIKGKSQLSNTHSENNIEINNLYLPEIATLIPQIPITFQDGRLNTNIKTLTPSLPQILATEIHGNLDLTDIQGKIRGEKITDNPQFLTLPLLNQDIIAKANINLSGRELVINQSAFTWGDFQGEVRGSIDTDKGYQLTGNINTFSLNQILPSIGVNPPLTINGNINSNLILTGKLDNPQLEGKVEVKNSLVDKIELGEINTQFTANLDQVEINQLTIQPTAGGIVTSQGLVTTNLRQVIFDGKPFQLDNIPLNLEFNANLPPQELINSYGISSTAINLGNLLAKGNIKGNLIKPEGLVTFSLPNMKGNNFGDATVTGELAINQTNLSLENTALVVNNRSQININGNGDFQTLTWEMNIFGGGINLNPLFQDICQSDINFSCDDIPLNLNLPINLAKVDVAMGGNLKDISLNGIEVESEIQLSIDNGSIELDTNLINGNLILRGNGNQISLDNLIPSLPTPITLASSQFNLSSNLQDLLATTSRDILPSSFNLSANNQLSIDREGLIMATVKVSQTQTNVIADVSQISLDKFISSLPTQIKSSQLNINVNTGELLQLAKTSWQGDDNDFSYDFTNLESFRMRGNIEGILAEGNFTAKAVVNNNLFSLEGVTNNLSLTSFISQLGDLGKRNTNANVRVTGNVSELISFASNYLDSQTLSPLSSLNIVADGNLNTSEGKVNVSAKLNNSQWQSLIRGKNLNFDNLLSQIPFIKNNPSLNFSSLGSLTTNIHLQGNISNLVNQNISLTNFSLPVTLQPTVISLGDNEVKLKGSLDLVNVFSQPDVSNLQLEVTTQSDLSSLPINSFLSLLVDNSEGIYLFPTNLDLDGKAEFEGIIKANNLLTTNPLNEDSLSLLGNLTLTDFRFNDLAFESYLTGKVNFNPSQSLSLDVRGKKDVIATSLAREDFIIANTVTFPFSLNNIQISQGGDKGFSLTGKRENNLLFATVKNFDLETLQLQPVLNYGLSGNLRGNVNTNLTFDFTNFNVKGNINISNPAIGIVEGKEIAGDFIYQDNIAELNQARLRFGETEYQLAGMLNLATQEVTGNINLQGEVEDIFNTLQIGDVTTLTAIIQQLQQGDSFQDATNIPPLTLGNDTDTIKTQINLLSIIDESIRAIALQIEEGKIPDDLEIRGKYQGEIQIGGKLTNPEMNISFEGNQWRWLPQQSFPNLINPLGLVMQETQVIPISQIALKANFKDNNLDIKPFVLNVADTEIFFAGNLSFINQIGEFKIKNLSSDLISYFLPLSPDIDSLITIEGNLKGNFANPTVKGNITLNDTSIQGEILEEKITADFSYQEYQLNINTKQSAYINLVASLPYHPFIHVQKPSIIDVKFKENAVNLLSLLTNNQLQLRGNFEGNLSLYVDSISKLVENFSLDKITIAGNFNFDNTSLNTTILNETILLSGNVNILENQEISINQLTAKVNNTNIDVNGNLPLFNNIQNQEKNLTLKIDNQPLKLEGLYSGKVDANIDINGSLIKPNIGGYLSLNNGNFEIPSNQINVGNASNDTNKNGKELQQRWLGNPENNPANSLFQPQLDNFTIKLTNSQLSQWGLYRFLFDGNLVVNGGLSDLENTRAVGAINLRRGKISVGGANPLVSGIGSGQTTFFLSRTNENQIIFDGQRSVLNPDINIQVQGDIIDYSRQLPSSQRNEVIEPILRGGRGENIQVTLEIDGELRQILPMLYSGVNSFCALPPSATISEETSFSTSRLNQVSQCTNIAFLNKDGSNFDILNSPLVNLSSIPRRSQGELINLIVGGQLLNFASQLQNLSGADLFENGLVQLVLVPIANNITFGINETVSSWGKPLGMKDLRVFPLVEGIYQTQENSNVSVSYDYIYGEFKVKYHTRF